MINNINLHKKELKLVLLSIVLKDSFALSILNFFFTGDLRVERLMPTKGSTEIFFLKNNHYVFKKHMLV